MSTLLIAIMEALPRALPEAIGLIADLVEAGRDPAIEIRRIRDTDPMLADVERAWEVAIERKWPRGAPDTLEDIYEGLDPHEGGEW